MKYLLRAALTLVCAALLLVSGSFALPETEREEPLSRGASLSTEEGMREVVRRGSLTLYADLRGGQMEIEDRASGKRWYTNPPTAEEDSALGYDMQLLNSQVVLYANMMMENSLAPVEAYYASSSSGCTIRSKLMEDGVIFVYDFQKPDISVAIYYTLTGKGFRYDLLCGEVEERGLHTMTRIEILPAFGAGYSADEGYMLIPDGSGALVYLNNQKSQADKLKTTVYGFNAGLSDRTASTLNQSKVRKTLAQDITLPVFGYKVNDDAYLAVIRSGEAKSQIHAQSGGQGSAHNLLYLSYIYREQASVRMLTKGFNQEYVNISEAAPDTERNLSVEFIFLPRGQADYAQMAAVYREDLLENSALEKRVEEGDIPFYLDIYGYIRKIKPFLGIPRDTVIPMTTYTQAAALVESLRAGAVENIVIKYNYWQKNGYYDSVQTKARIEGKLGGKGELAALEELADSLFLSHEPINAYKSGGGFVAVRDAHKSVARTTQKQYVFSLSNASVDTRYAPWSLLRPQRISAFFSKYLSSFERFEIGDIALESIGTNLYSELGRGGISRNASAKITGELLAAARENNALLLNGAYAYAAVYADHIINTPQSSSAYDLCDESVPFYQMVFHGYVYMSLSPHNLSSNPSEMLLRCLETGSSPLWSWVYENAGELIGSRSDSLYSADYSRWLDTAVKEYAELNAVLSRVGHLPITAHSRTGDIAVTEYGGSIRVAVNYGAEDGLAEGKTVAAKGYTLWEV